MNPEALIMSSETEKLCFLAYMAETERPEAELYKVQNGN
jgi:hypothetical protein